MAVTGKRRCDRPDSKQRLSAKLRRIKTVELRTYGMTLRQIGEQLGVSYETVRKDMDKALADLHEVEIKGADKMRTFISAQYDLVLRATAKRVVDGDMNAADRYLKALDAKRKLYGVDEPIKQEVSVQTTPISEMSNEELEEIINAGKMADMGDAEPATGDDGSNADG